MTFKTTRFNPFLLGAAVAIALTGCKPEEIKQYRVAKVAEPPMAAMPAQDEKLSFKTPSGWLKQASTGMRTASFSIKGGGDVSVVTLPGMAGDLKGNINRWRGQVGLPPLEDPQAIQASVTPTTIDGAKAIELDLYAPAGKDDKAMRVALFEKDGVTWFFKLAGPRELVKAQKASFAEFTRSVKIKKPVAGFGEPAGGMPPMAAQGDLPPMPDGQATDGQPAGAQAPMPEDHPPMAGQPPADDMNAQTMPPITPQTTDTSLTYKVPGSWKEKAPSAMRVASFEAKQGDQAGDISIVSLAGDGGGLLSNTNRWRQQLEMAPTDQAGLKNTVKDINVNGNKGYFMALYTGMEGKGMLVALIEQGGQTWFVKMTGPSKLIQSQEKDFQGFVQSIQFHAKGNQT